MLILPTPTDPAARAEFRNQLADELQHRQALVTNLTLDTMVGELVHRGRGVNPTTQATFYKRSPIHAATISDHQGASCAT